MFSESYSIHDLNHEIQSMICKNKVNNLRMVVAADNKSKLSVTLRPNTTFGDQYHGLHPRFNEELLRTFLKELKVNSASGFWEAVNKYKQVDPKLMNILLFDKEYMNLSISKAVKNIGNNSVFEISFLGKAFLQIASHFGYLLKCDGRDQYDAFKKLLNKVSIAKDIYWQSCDELFQIKLLGIWPMDFIHKITAKYDAIPSGLSLMIQEKQKTSGNNFLYSLLTFQDNWNKYFNLLTSDIYYSGVFPCVKKIDYETNSSTSNKVKYLIFEVVRTTFATVDTMDNSQILKHHFFKDNDYIKYYNLLIEFDRYEAFLQEKYLYKDSICNKKVDYNTYDVDMLDDLNSYLKHSLNTHTIATSTNLITDDGYLLAGKRGALNIDAGEFYCSANGQSEFLDENVDFYRKSVFEDMPTMDYYSKYRVDLNREVQRECIAELGVTSFAKDWSYYGVSFLSINNNITDIFRDDSTETKTIVASRMHFNVLMSNTLQQSFKEVVKSHKIATENFENEEIVGLKIQVFKSKREIVKAIALGLFYWLDENKSRMLLLLVFISIIIGKRNYSSLDISSYIDIGLIIIYLIISAFSWLKNIKIRKKKILKYYYYPGCFDKQIFKMKKVIDKLSKKTKKAKFHAIFNIMYSLYFMSIVESDK